MLELASIVDICNMALYAIGETTITSLEDGTKASTACNALWVPTRDYIQSCHPWSETMKRATLTASATSPNHEWTYAYTLPSDYLALIELYEHDAGDSDYVVEGGYLLSDETSAKIIYIAKISDTTKWSTELVEAVRLKLAMELCIPLSARVEIWERIMTQFYQTMRFVRTRATKKSYPEFTRSDSWITARSS